MKAIIVYESRYGNTKLVAEKIAEGINEVGGTEVSIKKLREADPSEVSEYDVILIGSPNHFGGPTRGIGRFIDKLGKLQLQDKMFVTFDTCFEKAVRKMERRVKEKAPGLKQLSPGLTGPVRKGPTYKGTRFKGRASEMQGVRKRIAAQLRASS